MKCDVLSYMAMSRDQNSFLPINRQGGGGGGGVESASKNTSILVDLICYGPFKKNFEAPM